MHFIRLLTLPEPPPPPPFSLYSEIRLGQIRDISLIPIEIAFNIILVIHKGFEGDFGSLLTTIEKVNNIQDICTYMYVDWLQTGDQTLEHDLSPF